MSAASKSAVLCLLALGITGCDADIQEARDTAVRAGTQSALQTDILAAEPGLNEITFTTDNTNLALREALSSAAGRWDNAYGNGAFGNPRITSFSGSADKTIYIVFDTLNSDVTSTGWCGGGTHIVEQSTTTCSVLSQAVVTQDLTALLTHEMGNLIGWSDLENHWALPNASTVLSDCAMYVGSSINGSPCAHEEQWAFFVYGQRDTVDMNAHLVGEALISSDSVAPNDSVFVPISYLSTTENGPAAAPTFNPTWTADSLVTFGAATALGVWVRSASREGTTQIRAVLQNGTDPTVRWKAGHPVTAVGYITVADTTQTSFPVIYSVEASPFPTYVYTSTKPSLATEVVTGTAFDASHNVIPGATFDWWIDDTSIATIDGDATGVGSVTVLAVTKTQQRTTLRFRSSNNVEGAVSIWVNCLDEGGCE